MNNKLSVIILPLLLFATLLPGIIGVPTVNSQFVGTVCIAEVGATSCPLTPPTFTGPFTTPNATRLLVSVFIENSEPVLGWDVTLTVDSSKLRPADADVTGHIAIGSLTILGKCIGGAVAAGNCAPWAAGDPNTLEMSVIGSVNSPFPVTGLLFTASFDIVGSNSAGSPLAIGYKDGCSPTISSSGTLCIGITDGTANPVPENPSTGGFDNSTPPPYAALKVAATTNTFTILPGDLSTKANVTETPTNGFETSTITTVTLTASVKGPAALTASLNPGFLDLNTPGDQNSTLTVSATSATAPGNYNITVLGTYQLQDSLTLVTSTLSQPVKFYVAVVDYTISRNPTTISITTPQTSATTTVTIASLNNFAGLVKLGTTLPSNATGVTATYSPATITGSGTSTLNITITSNTQGGTYPITIRSNTTLSAFTRSRPTLTLTLTVVTVIHDLAVNSVSVDTSQASVGGQVTFTINVQNKGNVQETLQVSALANDASVASQNVTLAAGASQTITLSWNTGGYAAGTYQLGAKVLTVTGETNTNNNIMNATGTLALSPAPTTNVLTTTLLIIIGVVAAIVVIGLILALRRRPKTQQ